LPLPGFVPLGVCNSVLFRPAEVEGGPLGLGLGFVLRAAFARASAAGDEYPLDMKDRKSPFFPVAILVLFIALSFCGTLKRLVSLNQKLLHPILSLKPSLPHGVKSLHPTPFLTFRSPARNGYGEQPAYASFGPTESALKLPWLFRLPYQSFSGL